jgi:hypothetical protein
LLRGRTSQACSISRIPSFVLLSSEPNHTSPSSGKCVIFGSIKIITGRCITPAGW